MGVRVRSLCRSHTHGVALSLCTAHIGQHKPFITPVAGRTWDRQWMGREPPAGCADLIAPLCVTAGTWAAVQLARLPLRVHHLSGGLRASGWRARGLQRPRGPWRTCRSVAAPSLRALHQLLFSPLATLIVAQGGLYLIQAQCCGLHEGVSVCA